MNQKNQNNSQGNSQPKATSEIQKLSPKELRPSNLGKGGERRLDTAQFSEHKERDDSDKK